MAEISLRYCCFYHPFDKSGFQGQKNLSVHIDRVLSDKFSGHYQKVTSAEFSEFPSIFNILKMQHRLLWWRAVDLLRLRNADDDLNVTVVDMIHSVVALNRQHSRDHLVLIGHDSYSLRAWRQLMQTGVDSVFVRTAAAWLCWRYAEFLARRLFVFQFFVSPIDCLVAGHTRRSGVLPIPLSEHVRDAASQRRLSSNHHQRKLLVPVAVVNPTQNTFDIAAVKTIIRVCPPEIEITLWGGGAETLRPGLEAVENLKFVTWVEDYAGFLGQFDAVIYPRIVGSGFHTKLAEVLALGIPSLCIEWIAEALTKAGYRGLSTFNGPNDFETAVRRFCSQRLNNKSTESTGLPRSALPKYALRPLVSRCEKLLTAVLATRISNHKQ